MRRINKGTPPPELIHWIHDNPQGCYNDMGKTAAGKIVPPAIRRAAMVEQHCLCAYCCNKIDEDNCHNEHVQAQSIAPDRTVDFDNIVASCNMKKQCGSAHKNQPLPLTPLTQACETDLKFYLSGQVKGINAAATEAIKVLSLDNPALRRTRKEMVDTLIYVAGDNPNELALFDDDLLNVMLDDFQEVGEDGCLEAFSPVLINIVRHLLAAR